MLQVRGRRSGRVRTTLARPIVVGGKRYLVAIRGETQWARNLRASGMAVLRERGESTRISTVEVHRDGHIAVGVAARQEPQHLHLPLAEAGRPVHRLAVEV
ncbi:MAG TPA: nitroreductase/quinone reductase family protein [Candidatus Dormibacteraeota bacterium]